MSNITSKHLDSSLAALSDRDILAELLADKRSPNTRRAYAKDIKDFFQAIAHTDPSPALIEEFLSLERFQAISLVLKYKSLLVEKGLSEATVNRRLASIKSLANYARKIGKCEYSLEDVKGEKVQAYRDTSGIDSAAFKTVLDVPDRATLKGKRDYAMLRLLWENALRRGEVSATSIQDFDLTTNTLKIYGKGRGTQAEIVHLSPKTVEALQAWLQARGKAKKADPLFIALDRVSYGHRLTGTAIYKIVAAVCKQAGIPKLVSPHRIRHSSITALLDATGGDVRMGQKLSRHANLNTLTIYDDRRANVQKEATTILADLV